MSGLAGWRRRCDVARRDLTVASLVALAGCAVGPTYTPPEPSVPDVWQSSLVERSLDRAETLHAWWRELEDPQLTALIERAGGGNLTVRQALARIRESGARVGVAAGRAYPDVDAVASASQRRQSAAFPVAIGDERTNVFYSVGLDATWEIDFWGRIARSTEAADADFDASVEDYHDALVSLYAEVATTYIAVRSLQQRLEYAAANARTQRGTLTLTRDRLEAGLVGELDVRQAELNLATTESLIPSLDQRLAEALNRLGVLAGLTPRALHAELAAARPIPRTPRKIAGGIPAELLRQRPDLRAAERRLAAQTARIGVATAELYPRFSLTGAFAFEATADVLDWSKRAFSFGPALRWNLFDAGRVRALIDIEDARAEQALLAYEQTLLLAIEDVDSALVAYDQELARERALARSVDAAEQSVELVDTLYRTGLTDFQNVLDTQRSLFRQQDSLAESRGLVGANWVSIYRALGGGWVAKADRAALEQ